MKIKCSLQVIMTLLFTIPVIVNAECTYQQKAELNEIAGKIKSNYEANVIKNEVEVQNPDEADGVMMTVTKEDITFIIKLYNITENVYVTQSSDIETDYKDIYYADTENGIYTFTTKDIDNIIKYTFTVYSNNEGCSGDALKTIYLTKPKINLYYYYGLCKDLEDKIAYCKQFITEEMSVNEAGLIDAVYKYQNPVTDDQKKDSENQFMQFIKNNYIYILIGVGIAIGTATAIIIVRKRRIL